MFENRVEVHYENNNEIKNCIYWMQQSQRVSYNHSLEYAINVSNYNNIHLVVVFILMDYPEANERHYKFMVEGLVEVSKELRKRGIGFIVLKGNPEEEILRIINKNTCLVMDKGYLKIQRKWRKEITKKAKRLDISKIVEVDSDLIVPVKKVSEKEEYSARTIRPKIFRQLENYDRNFYLSSIKVPWENTFKIKLNEDLNILDIEKSKNILNEFNVDSSVKKSKYFDGGYKNTVKRINYFLENNLNHYKDSNSPANEYISKLSPYLHFGQISSLEIYHRIYKYLDNNKEVDDKSVKSFIEQLVVRRELAFNYVYYRKNYDSFSTMTNSWAYTTMNKHKNDIREYIYKLEELESFKTHDLFWNTAMKEMVYTGYMHGYMRMYWCKKIIEWSNSFEEAYNTSVYLNNKYFIDGRDANSYTGVAWCFGLHDRGWTERNIFGKLRYMNLNGLKRKFDMEKYIDRVSKLEL